VRRTVVPLSNSVLYPTPFGEVGDLRPVLVGICTCALGTVVGVRAVPRYSGSGGSGLIRV
jgi:hypothetical protein